MAYLNPNCLLRIAPTRNAFPRATFVVALVAPTIAGTQTLEIVPLDEAAAEVQTFKERRAANSVSAAVPFAGAAAALERSDAPSDLFIVGIVPKGRADDAGEPPLSVPDVAAAAAATQGLGDLVFDDQNKTWMSISYPPPIAVDVYCSWRVDPAALAAAELDAAEEALEAAAVSDTGPTEPTAIVTALSPREAAAVDLAQDPEFDDVEIEKAFTVAGRACTARHLCNGADDTKCTTEYLDSVIAQVDIIQLGDGQ